MMNPRLELALPGSRNAPALMLASEVIYDLRVESLAAAHEAMRGGHRILLLQN